VEIEESGQQSGKWVVAKHEGQGHLPRGERGAAMAIQ
jgi:hypothetical protein